MQRNYNRLLLGIIIGLIIGLFIGKQFFENKQAPGANVIVTSPAGGTVSQKNDSQINNSEDAGKNNSGIPQKV